jgi:hypothetical protein
MRSKPQLARSKPVPLGLLQEWLRTAALAKRTRDASSTRARLSLCAQRFRGVGQGGRSPGVSGSSPPGRPAPPLADRMGRESPKHLNVGSLAGQGDGLRLGRSRWSGHYPQSEAWGSAPLVRSRTVANCDSRVMTPLTRSATVRSEALGELHLCQKTHPVLPRPAQSDWPSFGSSFLCPR